MTKQLDTIAKKYSEKEGFEKIITDYKIKEIISFVKGNTILDVGCGEGVITKELARKAEHVVGIDGSAEKLERAKKSVNSQNIRFEHTLFDEYRPDIMFDTAVISNVFEHVDDAVGLLKNIHHWLKPVGRIIATVPNANSLPRKIGLASGFIKDKYELTSEDIKKGHVRVYDAKMLREHVEAAGFRIVHIGGIFFKPFAHRYMEMFHDEKLYEALYMLRHEFSDSCSSLIIIADSI